MVYGKSQMKLNLKRNTLCLLLVSLMASSAFALDDPIKLHSGEISGTTVSPEVTGADTTVRVYRGIPYGAPPVGNLRWRPPREVAPWQGVRECTEFGSSCLFVSYGPDSLWHGKEWSDVAEQSEDCLYLNVWTAAKSPDEKLPVMLWIHGGSLTQDSSAVPAYGGANLAKKGVVVVTINYRLGPFGFMAHPELSKESEHGSSGNYGVLDQIAALKWVQRNIAAFGGDPQRVTIFGESAGAWSVCFLGATPLAKGLYHRGIGQSSYGLGPMTHLTETRHGMPPAENTGLAFAKHMGANGTPATLAQLRALPAKDVLSEFDKAPGAQSSVNVDGWVFPDEIRAIYQQGRQNPVDVIVGSNADEGTIFVGEKVPDTVEKFTQYARKKFGDMAEKFLQAYPVADDTDVRKTYVDSLGDDWFTWHMRTWARSMKHVETTAFHYYFTRVQPNPKTKQYGAYHGAEIIYVMGNFHLASFEQEAADRRLADAMSTYWTNFARTGNPNGVGVPEWPPYEQETESYMELGDTIGAKTHLLKNKLDFFDEYNKSR